MVLVVTAAWLLGACGDDENAPQTPETGDTLPTPTSGGPGPTTGSGETPPTTMAP